MKPTTALLSCFIQKPDLLALATDEGFNEDMFSGDELVILRAVKKMVEDKTEISFYTVAIALKTMGMMSEEIGFVFEEMRRVESASGYDLFLLSVFKEHKTRILKVCGNIIDSSRDVDDPSEIIESVASTLESARAIGGGSAFNIAQAASRAEEEWLQSMGRGYVGIPSSIHELTARLGGYREGVITILGGYRGEGKSTLVRQELSDAVRSVPCAHFPLEESGDQVVRLIAGYRSRVSIDRLDRGKLSRQEIAAVTKAMRELDNDPLYIMDKETHIDRICSSIMRLSGRGVRMYGLDHIQRIEPANMRGYSRNDTMASHMSRLSNLIKRVNGAGLFLSQLTRSPESENRPPKLSDLRDSGSIEQDARAVLLLWFEDGSHRIKIAKNNNGESGAIIKLKRVDGEHRFETLQ